jgi:hypothetical protein
MAGAGEVRDFPAPDVEHLTRRKVGVSSRRRQPLPHGSEHVAWLDSTAASREQ